MSEDFWIGFVGHSLTPPDSVEQDLSSFKLAAAAFAIIAHGARINTLRKSEQRYFEVEGTA
jgi:hypothetical protein